MYKYVLKYNIQWKRSWSLVKSYLLFEAQNLLYPTTYWLKALQWIGITFNHAKVGAKRYIWHPILKSGGDKKRCVRLSVR